MPASRPGKTPLDLALENGHEDVVRVLVARGARIYPECLNMVISRSDKRMVEHVLTKFRFGDIQSQIDLLEIVKMLLDKGLDQDHALVTANNHGKEVIVTLLLEQGTNPDVPSVSWPRKPAIKAAIGRRHISIIKALLCHGAHVDAEDLWFVRYLPLVFQRSRGVGRTVSSFHRQSKSRATRRSTWLFFSLKGTD